MPQITGIVSVEINGKKMRTTSVDLETGGFEGTAVKGTRVYGYSYKVMESKLSLTIAHTADVSIKDLNGYRDATVKCTTDTGVTWLIAHAATITPASLSGDQGEMSFEMGGDPAEEI